MFKIQIQIDFKIILELNINNQNQIGAIKLIK